jgi:thiamine biosynthesis protein ThiI
VLRPLLGFDKDEIVDLARRVGTYDLSAKVPEYCALHGRAPATAVSAADLDDAEQAIDLEAFATDVAGSPRVDLRVRRRPEPGAIEPLAIDHVPEGAVVIDLRSPAAFAAWHYPDALRMDYTDALRAHAHVDPSRTYLVRCEVEFKSADLAERMRAAGRRAHYFAGGDGIAAQVGGRAPVGRSDGGGARGPRGVAASQLKPFAWLELHDLPCSSAPR